MAEPGGAAALAALVCGAYRPAEGERVAVIVCGSNTDPAALASLGSAGGPQRARRRTLQARNPPARGDFRA